MRSAFVLFLLLLSPLRAAEPVNIVLVLADDLGWADLGCYGSRLNNTPNLDQLAADGLRFTDAACAQPICSPSRAAIMTGRAPARLHLTDFIPGRPVMPSQRMLKPEMRQELPLNEATLAELLKPSGYVSGCFGKWHLGGKGFAPEAQGFDSAMTAPGESEPSAAEGGKSEHAITDAACRWIAEQKDRPFFCYVAHHTPHIPLKANPDLEEKYRKAGAANPTYAAMLETLDECAGKIVRQVDSLGLKEKTIVIFISDNGGLSVVEMTNTPATSNAPLRAGKGWLYEGGLRIPLIIRWPGKIPAGRVERTPVINTDLAPSLLELCGAAPPAGHVFDGVSLAGLVLRGKRPDRPALFWHYPHYSNQRGFPGGAMREGRWKLVENFDTGHAELYNLEDDPGESLDLSRSMPARTADMRAALDQWRKDLDAQPMRGPNPEYRAGAAWTLIRQRPDGNVLLHSEHAEVHGTTLRYEPNPKKVTLGYWVRKEDWASWDFEIAQPGGFRIELLTGCGNGSGGSEVEVSVAGTPFAFIVKETGGFQNFVPLDLGVVNLPAGRHTLTVKPKSKPGAAVMDLRQIVLKKG